MSRTLQAWQDELGAWGEQTFGQTPQSVWAHLLSEACGISAQPAPII